MKKFGKLFKVKIVKNIHS